MIRMSRFAIWVALALALLLGSCSDLPRQLPPLRDLEEPIGLFEEPDDEALRQALPRGSFTGVRVGAGGETLEELMTGGDGVVIESIVENSPGEAAGLEIGDVLFEALLPGEPSPRPLSAASEWRRLELEAAPGAVITLQIDRAGREVEVSLTAVPRWRSAAREEAERFREEERVGVVVRTATEVEARAAGLGPGGGAVIVGLARSSPWRQVGLAFGDLIVSVDGRSLSHPQLLLDGVRAAEESLPLTVRRGEEVFDIEAPVSERESHLTEIWVPLIFSYEADLESSDVSLPLGLIRWSETSAAWRLRLLWLFTISGGETDVLEEVDA